ncbi:inositol-pentakisphosphate 2-kinase isoform X1 [Amyelois transitella]|uniref:inositol-pentakisphosphate 2-kinase isoform X1 n=1 Tax=Amyelois transitella TaxID=680683 RepID=UPI0029906AE6|nr:inositol-pentakisphosphate 2-kinase isoform X1 [Amyelois transitella]
MSWRDFSWKYMGEGNAHVVLEILNSNYVLRLIKKKSTTDKIDVEKSVEFVNKIMVPLLFHHSLELCEIVTLEPHEVIKLSEELMSLRPEYRRIKSSFSHLAIKAPNLSIVSPKFVTNYCLEIKPKEGFLSNNLRRYSKCYFCLKQYLKLQEKKIDSVSHYCPLDLFSGDKVRMRKALLNLISNPQNNLKFFRNGMLIYHEKSSRNLFDSILEESSIFGGNMTLFLDSMIKILLSGYEDKPTNVPESSNHVIEGKDAGSCIERDNLHPESFLNNLLEIQKLSELNSDDSPFEGTEYVSSILRLIDEQIIDLKEKTDRKRLYSLCDPRYLALISAVAKDCSIMISFSQNHENNIPVIEIGDQKVSYKLSVTDLEPKSAQTLLKRKETENKLIEIYKKHICNIGY